MSVDRLSSEDQLILGADRLWPQDVGALAILDGAPLLDSRGACRIDVVRNAVGARLHRVPRFRQRIHVPRRFHGGPIWVDCAVDLEHHIGVVPLPRGAGEAALLAAVERVRRRRLDLSRPLWELWLLPGLDEGRVGLFMRMHHVVGDGRAAMTMLGAFLDAAADAATPSAPPGRPAPLPRPSALVLDNLLRRVRSIRRVLDGVMHMRTTVRRVRGALPALRELLTDRPGPKTSLDRLVGPHRRLALVRGRVDRVRRRARELDASVNDVLLAAVAGGLRDLLSGRGEPVEELSLPIFVPVSLRGRLHGPTGGNEISQMVVPLPVGDADPGRRLARIAAETSTRKRLQRASLGKLFGIGLVRGLMLKAVIRQRVNVTSACVTGPRKPLYLAGARILELFPLLNLIGNEPLGIGALSYAGAFEVAVIADGDAFGDLEILAAGLRRDLSGAEARPSSRKPVSTLVDS